MTVLEFSNHVISCKEISPHGTRWKRSSTEGPMELWHFLALNLLGPLPVEEQLLEMVDHYSRYYEVEMLNGMASRNVTEAF